MSPFYTVTFLPCCLPALLSVHLDAFQSCIHSTLSPFYPFAFLHCHFSTLLPSYPVAFQLCHLSTILPFYPVTCLHCHFSTLSPSYPVVFTLCCLSTLLPLYPVTIDFDDIYHYIFNISIMPTYWHPPLLLEMLSHLKINNIMPNLED